MLYYRTPMTRKVPYRPHARTAFLRLVSTACAAAMSMAAQADNTRPTGFRPPPHPMKTRRAEDAKASTRRLKATPLPSSWDSRDKGWVTSVKNQNPLGTCWTFAANAVIETQLLRTGHGTWDLSEKNMALLCGFEGDWNLGGNNDMAAAHLLRWSGAVMETNDVYFTINNNSSSVDSVRHEWEVVRPSIPLDPALHIQNVVWVPALDGKETTRNALKSAIMKYGAVSTCIYASSTSPYMNGGAYYCNLALGCDHAITVVGWDDNYSTNNFKSTRRPSANGAWLIKNSWGTSSGDSGYWHVSYSDKNFGVYDGAVYLPATSDENYTAVYGYDKLGPVFDFGEAFGSYNLQAAVFTSAWNETLAAVGVWSSIDGNPYRITIYTNVTRNAESPLENGSVACTQTGTLPHAGFSTIPLSTTVPLADKSNFTVVYEQTGRSFSHLADCHYDDYAEADHPAGCTYLGRVADGETLWYDLTELDIAYYSDNECDAPAAFCLKAYTRTTVPAKAGDAPGETADGTEALAALAATNALAYAQHGETFGAFAHIVGANGRTLWANWLAGLDPADPEDDFLVSIAVTNGVPSLSWKPDLGASRNYTIFGRYALSPESGWEVVQANKLATTTNRFFKVSLSPR